MTNLVVVLSPPWRCVVTELRFLSSAWREIKSTSGFSRANYSVAVLLLGYLRLFSQSFAALLTSRQRDLKVVAPELAKVLDNLSHYTSSTRCGSASSMASCWAIRRSWRGMAAKCATSLSARLRRSTRRDSVHSSLRRGWSRSHVEPVERRSTSRCCNNGLILSGATRSAAQARDLPAVCGRAPAEKW